ncbi:hypothetical protein HDE_13386 [Halotydeus destructor]|nr:hypothetical protein HDE_13386 [Halotydeus destructor]
MNKIRCSLRAETSERPTCTDSPIDFKVRGPEQERRARDDQEEEEEEEAEDRSLPVKGDTSEGHHRAAGPPLAGQGHLQGQHMQRSATTTSTSSSSSSSNHPFVCLACDKGFKYDHSLNFHIKSYHGNDTNNSNGHADTLLTMKGMNKKLSRSRKLASSSLLSPSNGTRIVADELMVTEDHGSDDEHQQHHLEDALNNNNNNNNSHDKRLSSLSSSSSSRGGRGGGEEEHQGTLAWASRRTFPFKKFRSSQKRVS